MSPNQKKILSALYPDRTLTFQKTRKGDRYKYHNFRIKELPNFPIIGSVGWTLLKSGYLNSDEGISRGHAFLSTYGLEKIEGGRVVK